MVHSPAAVLKIQVKGRICSLYLVLLSTIIEWGPEFSSPGRRDIIPPPMLANGVRSTPSSVILIEVVSISGILKKDTAITSSPGITMEPGSGDSTRKSLLSKSTASIKKLSLRSNDRSLCRGGPITRLYGFFSGSPRGKAMVLPSSSRNIMAYSNPA